MIHEKEFLGLNTGLPFTIFTINNSTAHQQKQNVVSQDFMLLALSNLQSPSPLFIYTANTDEGEVVETNIAKPE